MKNPNTEDLVTIGQPKAVAKVLDALPGMIGGLDRAIIEVAGQRLPFVLLVFGDNGAMHASNINPASEAVRAVRELGRAWDAEDPQAHQP
jgi:hypothetical protein